MLAFTEKCSLKCAFRTSSIEGTVNGINLIALKCKPRKSSITQDRQP